MTLGRWLLVHSFSIFLVSLFILGYIYRDELQLQQAYDQLLAQPAKSEHAKSPEVGMEESTQQQSMASPSPAISAQATSEQQTAPGESTSTDTAIAYIQSTPTIPTTIIDLNDLLLQARKAYWDKDYVLAIQRYQRLIEDDKTNPDYIGELGNIYYALNDYDNAAMHFYQAALILISQNKPEQARRLVSPISAMNRDLGDQLKQRLTQQ